MRLLAAILVAAAFLAGWAAIIWLVMMVTLYVTRFIPMAGWRRDGRQPTDGAPRP